jgi:membrane carboxypeptidase/penicillin-binding protein
MKRLRGIVLYLVAPTFILLGCATAWLFFYSRDLPSTKQLGEFAPTSLKQTADACLPRPVVALPYDQVGQNLLDAFSSVEVNPDAGGILANLFRERKGKLPHHAEISLQIARTMFCAPEKALQRHMKELRLAIQLERQFSRRQLFTIYLNRLYFGDCGNGVETASQCLFHKHAVDLGPAEAALIAGIAGRASYYSPSVYPDRAIGRRNAVLDAMVAAGKLSLSEAVTAKSTPLIPN